MTGPVVLVLPRRRLGNRYTTLLRDAVAANGVEVVPFAWGRLLLGRYDVAHIHWPEWFSEGNTRRARARAFARGLLFFVVIAVWRKPLMWTVHNLGPHREHSRVYMGIVRQCLAKTVTLLHVMTYATVDELARVRHPCRTKPYCVVRHGRYPRVTVGELQVVSSDVLYFGALHRYKGVEQLIDCVESMDPPVRLTIAGAPGDMAYVRELAQTASTMAHIDLRIGWLSDRELESAILGARLVVLPYHNVLNSGALLHALSLGRPALVPSTPTFWELSDAVGPGWVSLYEGELTPGTVRGAIDAHRGGEPNLAEFSWDVIGRSMASVYRRLSEWRQA